MVKFFAPWCGHCKAMKPAWDQLMAEFAGSKTVCVADVDCTASGKSLCEAHGVQGYPTLKQGDPSALENYEGGREFEELKTFVNSLKPVCSPGNMDLCDADGKAAIEAVMSLSDADITSMIADGDAKVAEADTTFDAELEALQAKYQELVKAKEAKIAEVKKSGLGMLKAVAAHKAKAASAGKAEL